MHISGASEGKQELISTGKAAIEPVGAVVMQDREAEIT